MAGRTENAFEVLEREEAAPEVEDPSKVITKQDVKVGLAEQTTEEAAPPTPERGGLAAPPVGRPEGQVAVEPDVSKAPGGISYAQAAQEHGEAAQAKAGESAGAGREAAGESAEAVKAKSGAALEGASQEAREAGQAVQERAGEAAESAKATATDVRHRAEEAAHAAREQAAHAAEVTREKAAQAGEAAREYAGAAKEQAADVAHRLGEGVQSAVEYVKERLPEVHVERQDTTPAERESQALLDEAMALATGAPAPIRPPPREEPAHAAAPPSTTASPAPAREPAPTTTTTALPAEEAQQPFHAYEPRTATEVADRTAQRAAEVAEAARAKGAELVGAAKDTAGQAGASSREALKEAAPDELARRVEGEEQGAKGPLEALADTVKGAVDYVKERVLPAGRRGGGGGSSPGEGGELPMLRVERERGSGRVHEYPALPGDLHPAQLSKAFREKALHAPAATEATAEDARDSAVGGMRAAGQEIEGTARAAADKAGGVGEAVSDKLAQAKEAVSGAADTAGAKYEQAKESVAGSARSAADRAGAQAERAKGTAEGAAGEARERASGALATAREAVSGAVHAVEEKVQAVEDKTKWAYEHTKEEAQAGRWREANVPHTAEEAAKARGEIPSDTESLLRRRAAEGHAEHEVREEEERGKMRSEELLEEAALAYGEENLAPSDLRDIQEDAEGAGPLADQSQPRGHHTTAGADPIDTSGLKRLSADVKEAARGAKEELKHELKDAVHEVDRHEPGEEGEIPS